MPILFLHSGAPKTGTSYLQVLFSRYADQLSESGILYPAGHMFEEARKGEITSGNGVDLANYLRPQLPHQIADKDRLLEKLDATLTGARGKHVLLSSEFLFFPVGERSQSRATLAANRGYEVRVVYLVRDISAAAVSVYSQAVKRVGITSTFLEYLETWDPHYLAFLRTAETAFGASALHVHNYEEHRGRLADLMFRDILGTGFTPNEKPVVNRSLSPKEAEFQRLMNMAAPGNATIATFISDALMKVNHERAEFYPTHQEAELLRERFGKSTIEVNKFVRGRPIDVVGTTVDNRDGDMPSDFERSIAAVLSHIVPRVIRGA